MSQLRLNPLNGRWVTIVAERSERPTDFAPRTLQVETEPNRPCPFCPEHTEDREPTLETLDENGNWKMRVVPNRYPAFSGDDPMAVRNLGPVHVMSEASGIHEVFVFTPKHDARIGEMSDAEVGAMMDVLKERLVQHLSTPNIRYTQAIVNHGREAGASLAHPHGQILGLPFVPGEILDEERAFGRFSGGCILCATIEAEHVDGRRVVLEDENTLVLCPYWSGMPYELLIIPKSHSAHLTDASTDSLHSMGVAIKRALITLNLALGDVAFNLGFHTAPGHHSGMYHWHVHLWPKLVTTAGFERGTGVLINIVPPEDAALALRNAAAK